MRVFRKKRSGAEISRSEALNCIPVKNIQARETRGEAGLVLLSYPVETRPWIAGWIRRFGGASDVVRLKKLQLDTLGTAVWDLLDGKRTVGQVIQDFTAMQRLHPTEANVAVTLFLRELGKRGLIGLR
jgi:Coenzyme PQQ synthesis protein D (PqqD)